MCFASCNYIIIRFFLLKHQPHSFDIITSKSPISLSFEISKIESFLKSFFNSSCRPSYLSSNKGFSSSRRLMVKQNTIASKCPIGFSVIDSLPVSENFSTSIRTTRVKACGFSLRGFLNFSKHFAGTGLIKTSFWASILNCF